MLLFDVRERLCFSLLSVESDCFLLLPLASHCFQLLQFDSSLHHFICREENSVPIYRVLRPNCLG